MRDVIDNYRRLVGEFLISDTLDFGLEDAARKISSAAYRLGRRILPKSPPVEIPHADGMADASEFWSLVEHDIFEQQRAVLARYLDGVFDRMVSDTVIAESPLVKRAEEKRQQFGDVYEDVLRVASTIDWQNPVTADQTARGEAVAKVREQVAAAPKWEES